MKNWFLKGLTRWANFHPNQPKEQKIKAQNSQIRDKEGSITADINIIQGIVPKDLLHEIRIPKRIA